MSQAIKNSGESRQHAFVIEAPTYQGVMTAHAWVERELGISIKGNPDVAVREYGLLSVEEARQVSELAAGASFSGDSKVIIVCASRVYHEAQNALLKILEEPPEGTYIFLVIPSIGGLLPTLLSRVQVISPYLDVRRPTSDVGRLTSNTSEVANEFLNANRERRSAIIKRLTSGRDEEEKRELRDEAISLVNGIEQHAYSTARGSQTSTKDVVALLSDISALRAHLYDRSAPVKMILEHISLVIPKDLV